MKEEKTGEYETWLSQFGGYANSMTLRDYFAAKAMQAYLTAPDTGWDFDEMSRAAYEQADAMLKARET